MLSLEDVRAAKERIHPYIIRTPLLRVPALDGVLGCEVYLKPENLQRTGSFKIRGALNALLCLSEQERKGGVVACSSGNHAQGVACAAELLGVDAVIVMPENVNPVKLEGTVSYGAKVILAGTQSSVRDAKAEEIKRTEGRTLIHPYANDYVKAGQGTIGLEILEDNPNIETIVVPIGGGGMISGIATAAKGIHRTVRIIGAEPEGAPRYRLSREAGHPVWLDHVDTIADGTRTDHADAGNFPIIEERVDELVSVSDSDIRTAMRLIVSAAKLVAEPSSVMPAAAAQAGRLKLRPDEKTVFVISGGNNDLSLLKTVL